MKTSRYRDSQILPILKQAESGAPDQALCREHVLSSATFCKWRYHNERPNMANGGITPNQKLMLAA